MTKRAALSQPLTPAEERVVALLDEGLTDDEIAARLDCSRYTVRSHLANIGHKVPGDLPLRIRIRYWYHGESTNSPRTSRTT